MIKKIKTTLLLSVILVILGILLIPGTIGGSDDTTMNVVRMYTDELDGEWTWEASQTTKWVQEVSSYNGQIVITIRSIGDFLWEAPEGTLVFVKGENSKETSSKHGENTEGNGLGPVDWDPDDPYVPIGGQ
ncbi:hypothetical protein ACFLQQ_02940 [Actinomycetota bacterium]